MSRELEDLASEADEATKRSDQRNLDRDQKLDEKYGARVLPLHRWTEKWKRRHSPIERAIRQVLGDTDGKKKR